MKPPSKFSIFLVDGDLKKPVLENYKKRVFNRVISTIGVPILVWVLLESFFG